MSPRRRIRALEARQLLIARMIVAGESDKDIAAAIKRSPSRVRQIIDQIATILEIDRSKGKREQIVDRMCDAKGPL